MGFDAKAYKREYYHRHKEKRKQQMLEYYNSNKSKECHVYLLPEENYVGVTKNLRYRMYVHKNTDKRNVKNMRVLHSTTNESDAFELENLLHDIGYEGKHTNNMQKL